MDPKITPTTGTAANQHLVYKVAKRPKAATLWWDVAIPLEIAITAKDVDGNDYKLSWRDPQPSPGADQVNLVYAYTAEVRIAGHPSFAPLTVSRAGTDNEVSTQKGSMVKIKVTLKDMTPESASYCTAE